MRKQLFVLRGYGMPPNLNKYRNMSPWDINRSKKEWERIVTMEIRRQGILPIREMVKITYTFYFKRKVRHDPDNYACCAKFIQDGLVIAGVLIDDDFDHVPELKILQGGFDKVPYIEILLEEIA